MKNKIFFLGLAAAVIFSSLAFADMQKSSSASTPGMPADVGQEQMKKMQEQARQQQNQMMEVMKKQNPQMYEQTKAAQDLQDKINQITAAFFAGKISYASAKSQLHPLAMQYMKSRIDNVGAEIDQLQKRIQELKALQENPDKAADKQADAFLGKAQPGISGIPEAF